MIILRNEIIKTYDGCEVLYVKNKINIFHYHCCVQSSVEPLVCFNKSN